MARSKWQGARKESSGEGLCAFPCYLLLFTCHFRRGGQSAVLFHVDNTINGITATLNWDVDQLQPLPGEIDTTDNGTIFPDLGLEVRSLTGGGGIYTLNPSFADTTLHSDAGALTNSPNDNIEHIYFTGTLPAGDYRLHWEVRTMAGVDRIKGDIPFTVKDQP